ncbi:MAG: glutamine--fructose-6-phosphate transaminase (isomerizing) [Caldilineales bacterium]|nr:glutamine--fructose-6-phosphate transaminase (isomerizing) [Caldilineales bacterium]
MSSAAVACGRDISSRAARQRPLKQGERAMCGIVGYVGPRQATPIILSGLQRLEYRGYDSAGLAVIEVNGQVAVRRDAGKLTNLMRRVEEAPPLGTIGVGHTRWATHGPPTPTNAHPHRDRTGRIVVVQNGIVENFLALRRELMAQGFTFQSDTDTEVIVQLISREYDHCEDLTEAVRRALNLLRGPSAVVVLSSHEPDRLVVARLGNAGGVVIGHGQGEMFVASDIPAILEHTRAMSFLDDREMAVLTREGVAYYDLSGRVLPPKPIHTIPWDPVAAAKGTFRHFMQKEIFDQPNAITDTLRGRVDFATGRVTLADLNLDAGAARSLHRMAIVACGTSYYAGLAGKYLIENLARIPVEVDYASEYRYRQPILDRNTLVLAITQSGETVDTLAALDEARRHGARTAAIVNVVGSQAARMSDGVIYMQAGPEIGVASTKAYTTSLVDLVLLAMYLGQQRDVLDEATSVQFAGELALLPDKVGQVLRRDDHYRALAREYARYHNFLYLGRGINYSTAREGALKLKEISYIHAEGYPAGEMKHGPIALIDENMPTVAIALRDGVYDKMISQVEQVKARNGKVIAVVNPGDEVVARKADALIEVPETLPWLSPVVAVVPLQLLAYHIAVWHGRDVDQPRNLAKSVTVE